MTRISRNPVKEKVLDKMFYLLFETLGNKYDQEEFSQVIYELLSPTERIMIAKRVAIIFLLMKDIDYFSISQVLKVSSSTIANYHTVLLSSKGVVESLKSIVRNEKVANFLEETWLEFSRPGKPGVNWSNAWKTKNELERKKREGI
jgi:hypothetical protein